MGCTNVKVQGIIYPLKFDVYAMELLDDIYGDAQDALNNYTGRSGNTRKMKDIRKMFCAMANSGLHYKKMKEDVTEETLLHADAWELSEVSNAISKELKRSMHVRGAGAGEEDDAHHDGYLEAIKAEEAKNGETGKDSAPDSTSDSRSLPD